MSRFLPIKLTNLSRPQKIKTRIYLLYLLSFCIFHFLLTSGESWVCCDAALCIIIDCCCVIVSSAVAHAHICTAAFRKKENLNCSLEMAQLSLTVAAAMAVLPLLQLRLFEAILIVSRTTRALAVCAQPWLFWSRIASIFCPVLVTHRSLNHWRFK